MATEADIPEPASLLEKGVNRSLAPEEFNQPPEIVDYLVKSGNMEVSGNVGMVDIGFNAGVAMGDSFFESPSLAKVSGEQNSGEQESCEVDGMPYQIEKMPENDKQIQKDENFKAAEETEIKENEEKAEQDERSCEISDATTIRVKMDKTEEPCPKVGEEEASTEERTSDHIEVYSVEENPKSLEKKTSGCHENKEDEKNEDEENKNKEDEGTKFKTNKDIILETSLGQNEETNDPIVNNADANVETSTDAGPENESSNNADVIETAPINEKDFGGEDMEAGSSSSFLDEKKGPGVGKAIEMMESKKEGIGDDAIGEASSILEENLDIQNDRKASSTIIENKLDSPSLTLTADTSSTLEAQLMVNDKIEETSITVIKEESKSVMNLNEHMKDVIPLVAEHQEKNHADIVSITETAEICLQKVDKMETSKILPELCSEDVVKGSPEEQEHIEILEKTTEANNCGDEGPKSETTPEQKLDSLLVKHEEGKHNIDEEQAVTEASAKESRDDGGHIVMAVEDNINVAVTTPEHSKYEPGNEKIKMSSEVVSEETSISSESVTCAKEDDTSIEKQEESLDKKEREEKSVGNDDIKDDGIPKLENLPPSELNERVQIAEVEIPDKKANHLNATHSSEQETIQIEGEELQEVSDVEPKDQVSEEEQSVGVNAVRDVGIQKIENLPPIDLNEKIEMAEVESPNKNFNELNATHSLEQETVLVEQEEGQEVSNFEPQDQDNEEEKPVEVDATRDDGIAKIENFPPTELNEKIETTEFEITKKNVDELNVTHSSEQEIVAQAEELLEVSDVEPQEQVNKEVQSIVIDAVNEGIPKIKNPPPVERSEKSKIQEVEIPNKNVDDLNVTHSFTQEPVLPQGEGVQQVSDFEPQDQDKKEEISVDTDTIRDEEIAKVENLPPTNLNENTEISEIEITNKNVNELMVTHSSEQGEELQQVSDLEPQHQVKETSSEDVVKESPKEQGLIKIIEKTTEANNCGDESAKDEMTPEQKLDSLLITHEEKHNIDEELAVTEASAKDHGDDGRHIVMAVDDNINIAATAPEHSKDEQGNETIKTSLELVSEDTCISSESITYAKEDTSIDRQEESLDKKENEEKSIGIDDIRDDQISKLENLPPTKLNEKVQIANVEISDKNADHLNATHSLEQEKLLIEGEELQEISDVEPKDQVSEEEQSVGINALRVVEIKKIENLPPMELKEKIEVAEVESPKENANELNATHSLEQETVLIQQEEVQKVSNFERQDQDNEEEKSIHVEAKRDDGITKLENLPPEKTKEENEIQEVEIPNKSADELNATRSFEQEAVLLHGEEVQEVSEFEPQEQDRKEEKSADNYPIRDEGMAKVENLPPTNWNENTEISEFEIPNKNVDELIVTHSSEQGEELQEVSDLEPQHQVKETCSEELIKESPEEQRQIEILEKTTEVNHSEGESVKDQITHEQGLDSLLVTHEEGKHNLDEELAVTEASAKESKDDGGHIVMAVENNINVAGTTPEHSKDEPGNEKIKMSLEVVSEDTSISSESITCAKEETSIEKQEESLDKKEKEEKSAGIDDIRDNGISKLENLPLTELNENVQIAEVEIPDKNANHLNATHSAEQETIVEGEELWEVSDVESKDQVSEEEQSAGINAMRDVGIQKIENLPPIELKEKIEIAEVESPNKNANELNSMHSLEQDTVLVQQEEVEEVSNFESQDQENEEEKSIHADGVKDDGIAKLENLPPEPNEKNEIQEVEISNKYMDELSATYSFIQEAVLPQGEEVRQVSDFETQDKVKKEEKSVDIDAIRDEGLTRVENLAPTNPNENIEIAEFEITNKNVDELIVTHSSEEGEELQEVSDLEPQHQVNEADAVASDEEKQHENKSPECESIKHTNLVLPSATGAVTTEPTSKTGEVEIEKLEMVHELDFEEKLEIKDANIKEDIQKKEEACETNIHKSETSVDTGKYHTEKAISDKVDSTASLHETLEQKLQAATAEERTTILNSKGEGSGKMKTIINEEITGTGEVSPEQNISDNITQLSSQVINEEAVESFQQTDKEVCIFKEEDTEGQIIQGNNAEGISQEFVEEVPVKNVQNDEKNTDESRSREISEESETARTVDVIGNEAKQNDESPNSILEHSLFKEQESLQSENLTPSEASSAKDINGDEFSIKNDEHKEYYPRQVEEHNEEMLKGEEDLEQVLQKNEARDNIEQSLNVVSSETEAVVSSKMDDKTVEERVESPQDNEREAEMEKEEDIMIESNVSNFSQESVVQDPVTNLQNNNNTAEKLNSEIFEESKAEGTGESIPHETNQNDASPSANIPISLAKEVESQGEDKNIIAEASLEEKQEDYESSVKVDEDSDNNTRLAEDNKDNDEEKSGIVDCFSYEMNQNDKSFNASLQASLVREQESLQTDNLTPPEAASSMDEKNENGSSTKVNEENNNDIGSQELKQQCEKETLADEEELEEILQKTETGEILDHLNTVQSTETEAVTLSEAAKKPEGEIAEKPQENAQEPEMPKQEDDTKGHILDQQKIKDQSKESVEQGTVKNFHNEIDSEVSNKEIFKDSDTDKTNESISLETNESSKSLDATHPISPIKEQESHQGQNINLSEALQEEKNEDNASLVKVSEDKDIKTELEEAANNPEEENAEKPQENAQEPVTPKQEDDTKGHILDEHYIKDHSKESLEQGTVKNFHDEIDSEVSNKEISKESETIKKDESALEMNESNESLDATHPISPIEEQEGHESKRINPAEALQVEDNGSLVKASEDNGRKTEQAEAVNNPEEEIAEKPQENAQEPEMRKQEDNTKGHILDEHHIKDHSKESLEQGTFKNFHEEICSEVSNKEIFKESEIDKTDESIALETNESNESLDATHPVLAIEQQEGHERQKINPTEALQEEDNGSLVKASEDNDRKTEQAEAVNDPEKEIVEKPQEKTQEPEKLKQEDDTKGHILDEYHIKDHPKESLEQGTVKNFHDEIDFEMSNKEIFKESGKDKTDESIALKMNESSESLDAIHPISPIEEQEGHEGQKINLAEALQEEDNGSLVEASEDNDKKTELVEAIKKNKQEKSQGEENIELELQKNEPQELESLSNVITAETEAGRLSEKVEDMIVTKELGAPKNTEETKEKEQNEGNEDIESEVEKVATRKDLKLDAETCDENINVESEVVEPKSIASEVEVEIIEKSHGMDSAEKLEDKSTSENTEKEIKKEDVEEVYRDTEASCQSEATDKHIEVEAHTATDILPLGEKEKEKHKMEMREELELTNIVKENEKPPNVTADDSTVPVPYTKIMEKDSIREDNFEVPVGRTDEEDPLQKETEDEEPHVNDSNFASVVGVAAETSFKGVELEDKRTLEISSHDNQEKGSITVDTKGATLDSVDIDTPQDDALNFVEKRKHDIPAEADEAEENIKHEIQNEALIAGSDDQNEISSSEKISQEDNLMECSKLPQNDSEHIANEESKSIDENLVNNSTANENTEIVHISQAMEPIHKDSITTTEKVCRSGFENTGIKNSDEDPGPYQSEGLQQDAELHDEQSISKLEDAEILTMEETRDSFNQGRIPKSKTSEDDESSNAVEHSELINADRKGGTMKEEAFAKKPEASLKMEDAEKKAAAEVHKQELEAAETKKHELAAEETHESSEFRERLDFTSEIVTRDESSEIISETNPNTVEENRISQSVEQRTQESQVDTEEKTEQKLETENDTEETQNADDTTKVAILTKEVYEVIEKADDNEISHHFNKEENKDMKELHIASNADKRVGKVTEASPATTEYLKATDCNEQAEIVSSDVQTTKEKEETEPEDEGSEKTAIFSTSAPTNELKEIIKEQDIEDEDSCNMETTVMEVKITPSLEEVMIDNEKVLESNIPSDKSSLHVIDVEANLQESMAVEENSSNLASQLSTNNQEIITQENVIMASADLNDTDDNRMVDDMVYESKNQNVEELDIGETTEEIKEASETAHKSQGDENTGTEVVSDQTLPEEVTKEHEILSLAMPWKEDEFGNKATIENIEENTEKVAITKEEITENSSALKTKDDRCFNEDKGETPAENKEEISEVSETAKDSRFHNLEAAAKDEVADGKTVQEQKSEEHHQTEPGILPPKGQELGSSVIIEKIEENIKEVEFVEEEPKTSEEVFLQKEESRDLRVSQLELVLNEVTKESPSEAGETSAEIKMQEESESISTSDLQDNTAAKEDENSLVQISPVGKSEEHNQTPSSALLSKERDDGHSAKIDCAEENKKEMEVPEDRSKAMEQAVPQKEDPRELEVSLVDVQKESPDDIHDREDGAIHVTKDVSDLAPDASSQDHTAVAEDDITSDQLPKEISQDQNQTSSDGLLSTEQENGISTTADSIKEKNMEVEVEVPEYPQETTEEASMRKEEPREIKPSQLDLRLDNDMKETRGEVHEAKDGTLDEPLNLQPQHENKIRDGEHPPESGKVSEITGSLEKASNFKIETSEDASESMLEVHDQEVLTESEKTEIKEKHLEAETTDLMAKENQSKKTTGATEIMSNEVTNEQVLKEKDDATNYQEITLGEEATKESLEELEIKGEESLGDDLEKEIQNKELHKEIENTDANETIEKQISTEKGSDDNLHEAVINNISSEEASKEVHKEYEIKGEENLGNEMLAREMQNQMLSKEIEKTDASETIERHISTAEGRVQNLQQAVVENETIREHFLHETTDENVKKSGIKLNSDDTIFEDVRTETAATEKESDVETSRKEGAAGLTEATETTQAIHQDKRTSTGTFENKVSSEAEPEPMVSAGKKDVPQEPIVGTTQATEVKRLEHGAKNIVDENDGKAMQETKISLLDMMQKSTRQVTEELTEEKEPTPSKEEKRVEKQTKQTEKAKSDEEEEEEEGDEHKKNDSGSGSDARVMVEASRDINIKVVQKKSHHNILSGVGSKVKHSISKVRKAITGKSSTPKQHSPKSGTK